MSATLAVPLTYLTSRDPRSAKRGGQGALAHVPVGREQEGVEVWRVATGAGRLGLCRLLVFFLLLQATGLLHDDEWLLGCARHGGARSVGRPANHLCLKQESVLIQNDTSSQTH